MNRFDVIESLEGRTYFSPLQFSQATSFPTGTNPSDIVAADLTGNGITDVVTTNFGSASISILRGNGNGTFQPPVFYPVGNSPEQLTVADFNGDGKPDIVTVNEGDNTISVLLGNGDGTFQPATTYGVGVRPEAIAVGDLTGNGLQDIVVADDGSANVDVLMNNGNGTFQPPVSYAAGDDPDGVAVGDFNGDERPDIVVVNPLGSYLHVLLNNGNGTFKAAVTYTTGQTPRAVAIADLNSDGRPDIITSSLHDTAIDYLQGNGDGTFQPDVTYPTGFFPFSIAIADMNGDGRLDVVTSNELDNTVSVLLHTGMGTFLPLVGYHAGQAPVAVTTADLTGNGKPDILAADFNTNSISVLLNQTVFPHVTPTTITLTANQNPVEAGNRLVLTAQVTPTALSGRRPVGVVQFFDGDAVIGVGAISPNGIATIDPTKLTLGTHIITAHYAGDGVYAQALSSTITEQVVAAIQTVPLVQVTSVAVHLAKQYVPGDKGVVDVNITDIGDGRAKGSVGLQLYASASSTFDSTAFPITASRHTVGLNLVGGRTVVVPVTFTLPTTTEPVNYTIFAAISPVSGLTAQQVATVPAVGLNSSVAVLEFGRVPTHGSFKLTRTLATGSTISLSLSGPGTGTLVENADGGISVTLTGTGGFGTFAISGGPVALDYLADNSPIGHFVAPTATLAGQLSLNGSTGNVTLAGAVNSNLFIGGGAVPVTLSLGTVSSSSVYSAGVIRGVNVNTWSNTPADSITTAVLETITSAGDFGASLTVNGGIGPRDLGITSATIGGTVGNATWSIQRNVGALKFANVATGWSGSIHGKLFSLIDSGDFAGNLAAQNIGMLQIAGNLSNADILTGANFGSTARLSPAGDVFGRGILTSLVVSGNVTNSIVAAGLSPVGDDLLGAGTTLLRRSAIASITVSGALDDASRFLAVSLPVKASIDGIVLATAGDLNFQL